MMTLSDLLEDGRLHRHSPTRGEIGDLMLKAQRALHDAAQSGISIDNRFILAYHGALSAATAVIVGAGYRPSSAGHHRTVFRALSLVDADMMEVADYLDTCRRRRHQALYGRFGQVSESELGELLEALSAFIPRVKRWLAAEHPDVYPGSG